LVLIDFSYTTSYTLSIVRNFCSRTHRLATTHNVTDDNDDGRKPVALARPYSMRHILFYVTLQVYFHFRCPRQRKQMKMSQG